MPVPVVCPECAKKLKAPDKARGKALKCPSCGGRVPVPAGDSAAGAGQTSKPRRKKSQRREPVAAAGGGTGEFLVGLDLSRAEDHETEVCPRCGTMIEEEEGVAPPQECPKCGADLLTGGKGATARRKDRFKDRGEDPKVYYSKAPGDALTFLKKNVDVGVRLSLLTLFASAIACVCWILVIYCANTPPKMFWGLPAVVGTLFIPGCLWVLQEAVTGLTFDGKQKFKRFRFDALDCVSKAPRMVVWAAVAVWPMTVLDLIAFAAWLAMGLSPAILAASLALHAVVAFLFWPAGLGHMAMPVSGPGWNFLKVASGTAKNLGPVLFWAALTFAAFLPFLAVAGGTAALSGNRVSGAVNAMQANAAVYRAAAAEAAEAKKDEVRVDEGSLATIDWTAFMIPGVALIPLAFLFGFAAVYASRPAGLLAKMFRPSLGLITLAKEKKYVPKTKRRSELDDLDEPEGEGMTWGGVGLALVLALVVGAVGGFAYSMLGENVGIASGIGKGIFWGGWLLGLIAGLILLSAAFKESIVWGLAYIFVPVAGLIFIVMHWEQTKHAFVMNVGSVVIAIGGLVLAIATGGDMPFIFAE
ncbi:hypothetical protein [Alienimonas chondri]|uniref:Zinc ribbon domain-containing protein n=1 Tax=Alienimonas chondri TaxID=2681879 RepID=A0ABX1V8W3_9PLAN|nr:hypothetical protein [Alienimonas chondri]NNJ24568.1 hypothetical protein [Alienimonas chondri]